MNELLVIAQLYGTSFSLLQQLRHSNLSNRSEFEATVNEAVNMYRKFMVDKVQTMVAEGFMKGQESTQ